MTIQEVKELEVKIENFSLAEQLDILESALTDEETKHKEGSMPTTVIVRLRVKIGYLKSKLYDKR